MGYIENYVLWLINRLINYNLYKYKTKMISIILNATSDFRPCKFSKLFTAWKKDINFEIS